MTEFVLKTLPAIIAAVLASYLAAKWSLRKFYSEKSWQRKENAYVEIINALYDLVQYCEIGKKITVEALTAPKIKRKSLLRDTARHFGKLRRQRTLGLSLFRLKLQLF